jgi:hypothetical protein
MTEDESPRSPALAYRQIIDQLVAESESLGARLVQKEGVYSKSPDEDVANQLVARLTSADQTTLAAMLASERRAAFHDALATLSWWVTCRQIGLTYRGEQVPVDVSGMGLHGDYIGRLGGWQWPGEVG